MLPQICSQIIKCKTTDVIRLMNQPRRSLNQNISVSIKRLCESLYQQGQDIQQINTQIKQCQTELTTIQNSGVYLDGTLSVSKLNATGLQSRLEQIGQVGLQLSEMRQQLSQANQFYQTIIITQETRPAIQSFQHLIKNLLEVNYNKLQQISELKSTEEVMNYLNHIQDLTNFIIIVSAIKYLGQNNQQEQQKIINDAQQYQDYIEDMNQQLEGFIYTLYEELNIQQQNFTEDIIGRAEQYKKLQVEITSQLNQYAEKDKQLSICQGKSIEFNECCQKLQEKEKQITRFNQLKKVKQMFIAEDDEDVEIKKQIVQIEENIRKLQKEKQNIQNQIKQLKQYFVGLTPEEIRDVLYESSNPEIASQSFMLITQKF